MIDEQQIIKEICLKEIEADCYKVRIDGISAYSLIRRWVRDRVLAENDVPVMELKGRLNRKAVLFSVFKSSYQLCKLIFFKCSYNTVFYSFPRVDKVNGVFLEKFTDPLIEECGLEKRFVIFDHGRTGIHPKPRLHDSNIVYTDAIHVLSTFLVRTFGFFVIFKHRAELEKLFMSVQTAFGNVIERKVLYHETIRNYYLVWIWKYILRKISAQRIIGPSRDFQRSGFVAAHLLGIKAFELQHGITYAETPMYSGFRDEWVLPDFFLAFGNNSPLNVYGISENRILNIGWAFQDYLKNLSPQEPCKKNDVLVISDPEVTEAIFNVVLLLAEETPESIFYIRPHPHEVLSEQMLSLIAGRNNVKIQDKTINISIVLQGFENVVGENSTVLYEALAINKKVGKLFFHGLNPIYLEDKDRDSFWEIKNKKDFREFLNAERNEKQSKCIYSQFNKELFRKLIE